jgi:hypothetical protein
LDFERNTFTNALSINVQNIGSTTNLMKVPFEPEVRRW